MFHRVWLTAALAILAAVAIAGGQGRPSSPVPPAAVPAGASRLYAVGDIMECERPERAEAVGQLLSRQLNEFPNTIGLTLGDNSQNDGSAEAYECLNQSVWSGLRPRLFPVAGNHDYLEAEATGTVPHMFLWFLNTGPVDEGYYAFDYGENWRVIALNSELTQRTAFGFTPRARKMLDWLNRELKIHSNTKCIVAYMHRPPFSSGAHASPLYVDRIFSVLYKYGADLLLTGHEHFFGVFPPLDPDGRQDPKGVPTLIAGTGGGRSFPKPLGSRYGDWVVSDRLGILRLDLGKAKYDWKFLPVEPTAVDYEGTGRCHDNPSGYESLRWD